MKKILVILLIFLLSSISFYYGTLYERNKTNKNISQKEAISDTSSTIKENKHKIDIEEERCIAESDVYDYPICSHNSEKAWNNEIKKNLNLLKKVMSDDEYEYINKMNEEWEKSVNSETETINKFISNKDGIIYQTEGSDDISNLKKQYALLLNNLYYHYKENKELPN